MLLLMVVLGQEVHHLQGIFLVVVLVAMLHHQRQRVAAGLAEAFADTMVTELATRTDLAELRAELRLECEKLRSENRLECERLRTEVASSRSEILRWVVPLILAQLALSVGVLLRIAG